MLRPFLSFSVCLPFVAGLDSPALAQGDTAKGAELAAEHCTLCHDVTPDALPSSFRQASHRSPPSGRPSRIYARIVFPTMHSGMPEVAFYLLGKDEIENIVAYTVSLEE